MPACKHLNYTQEWRLLLCLQDRESFKRTGNSYAKRLKKMMGTTLMMLIMRKFPKMLMGSWSHIYWPLSLHLLIYAPLYATKSSILLKKKKKKSVHYGQAISCQHKEKCVWNYCREYFMGKALSTLVETQQCYWHLWHPTSTFSKHFSEVMALKLAPWTRV